MSTRKAPLVSVIIPAFNASLYLEETLHSVSKQSWIDLEIIVVDDGSTDTTAAIVRGHHDERLVLIQQQHAGACAARNNGFKISKGSFIQFLDADDILAPKKIKEQLNALQACETEQTKIAHCCLNRFKGNNVYAVEKIEPHKNIRQNLAPVEWLIANCATVTGCWLIPRALIEKAGLWNESLQQNQDGEYFARLIAHASEVIYCDKAMLHYRSDSIASLSKNKSKDATASKLKAIQLIEQHILSIENSARARQAIANKYLEFIYLNFIAHPALTATAESHIKELGGAKKMPGGVALRALSKVLGWKNAMVIKRGMNAKFKMQNVKSYVVMDYLKQA